MTTALMFMHPPHILRGGVGARRLLRRLLPLPAVGLGLSLASPLAAQTDYYNTDAGRPLRVEDAHAIERRAVELQFAPVRLERARGDRYQWGLEPEIAVGLLPRTQIEVGVPMVFRDGAAGQRLAGAAGIDLGILHQLNAETALPGFAVAASVLAPAGPLGPAHPYASFKAIATRTLPAFRVHVNVQGTTGPALPASAGAGADVGAGAVELSRWMAGVSVDRPFPLRSLLLSAEVVAEQPLHADEPVAWASAAGLRLQLSPRVAFDAGAGAHFARPEPRWFATLGAAVAVGLPWRVR